VRVTTGAVGRIRTGGKRDEGRAGSRQIRRWSARATPGVRVRCRGGVRVFCAGAARARAVARARSACRCLPERTASVLSSRQYCTAGACAWLDGIRVLLAELE